MQHFVNPFHQFMPGFSRLGTFLPVQAERFCGGIQAMLHQLPLSQVLNLFNTHHTICRDNFTLDVIHNCVQRNYFPGGLHGLFHSCFYLFAVIRNLMAVTFLNHHRNNPSSPSQHP